MNINLGFCIMSRKLFATHTQLFIKKLKKIFPSTIISPNMISTQPPEEWPAFDVIISFYHTTLPFKQVIKYLSLNYSYCPNNLLLQYALFDRRIIKKILESMNVNTPRSIFYNKTPLAIPNVIIKIIEQRFCIKLDFEFEEMKEFEDSIQIGNKIIKRPFIEKPANNENHNIYVYYCKNLGVRKLFRKSANKSSSLVYDLQGVRRDVSYIYEEFIEGDNRDIKVYAMGGATPYAETRKSPTVDGVVERDEKGNEKRAKIILKENELNWARKITLGFKQLICGFDMLRKGEESYVIDVNGWSFVKGCKEEYYENCAQVIKEDILKNFSGAIGFNRLINESKFKKNINFDISQLKYLNENIKNILDSIFRKSLSKVIRIYRHADRTPKNKIKVLIDKSGSITTTSGLFECIENHLQNCSFTEDLINKFGKNKETRIQKRLLENENVEIILKWGGRLTHTGRIQSEETGENLRYFLLSNSLASINLFNENKNIDDTFNRLLDNVKFFSTSEDRVQESAMIFAKAFTRKGASVVIEETNPINLKENRNKFHENIKDKLKNDFEAFKSDEINEEICKTLDAFFEYKESKKLYKTLETKYLDKNEDYILNQSQESLSHLIFDNYLCNSEIYSEKKNSKSLSSSNSSSKESDSSLFDCLNLIENKYEYIFNDKEYLGNYFEKLIYKTKSKITTNNISELYELLKYLIIHKRKDLLQIFNQEKTEKLFSLVLKYHKFINMRKYGVNIEEIIKSSEFFCGNLINKIISNLNSTDGTYIYFTKENNIHALFNLISNILPNKNINFNLTNFELDYLSYLSFLVYNDIIVISVNKGYVCDNIFEQSLDARHCLKMDNDEILGIISINDFISKFT
ncbi:putative histidine phosphatase [Hamiltosporidium magnivora]|uniref:Inositol hexakisphosphate and diphosphoinositol-pentakisphosphate kinase n=2 Tax=Hamiltosporidium magnivora TaxID=148818 RepID=A0A4Q9LET9_9MICR|nr:putative histidine phosphatase [Hamiltosporidium magnivora]